MPFSPPYLKRQSDLAQITPIFPELVQFQISSSTNYKIASKENLHISKASTYHGHSSERFSVMCIQACRFLIPVWDQLTVVNFSLPKPCQYQTNSTHIPHRRSLTSHPLRRLIYLRPQKLLGGIPDSGLAVLQSAGSNRLIF